MRHESYVHAVDNLEKLLISAKQHKFLFEEDLSTLSYNVFLLKMMPMYTGLERKPDVSDS